MSFFTGVLYIILAFGGVWLTINSFILLFCEDAPERSKENRGGFKLGTMWLGYAVCMCLFCQSLSQDHVNLAKNILENPKAFVAELSEKKIKGEKPTPAQVIVKIDENLEFLKKLAEQKDANSTLYREALDALLKERLVLVQELKNM